ncbi:MAG: MurR/RpiR family transcriptional regulator [Anaerococcus sp.]
MKIYDLLKKSYEKMNKKDLKIYSFVAQNKKKISNLSIEEFAELAGVNTSSVMSFTKKLGLDGYSELKYLVKWDDSEFIAINDKEIDYTFNDISLTMTMIKNLNLNELFFNIDKAKNLFIIPTGYSQRNAAEEFKKNFLNLERQLIILDITNGYNKLASLFKEDDILFIISFSGENDSLVEFINNLEVKPIIVSITKLTNNRISYLSDYNIPFITHEIYADSGKMIISPISQFYVIIEFLVLKYIFYKSNL